MSTDEEGPSYFLVKVADAIGYFLRHWKTS
jgi:hypothetical protein